MSDLPTIQVFPGSRLRYAESKDEFVLHIVPAPARAVLIAIPIVVGLLAVVAFGVFVALKMREAGIAFSWSLLGIACIGVLLGGFALLFLGWLFWGLVGGELTQTVVHVKGGHMSVRTRTWGVQRIETYTLSQRSFVKKWWGSLYNQSHGPADVTERPGGLVVSSDGKEPDKLCYDFGGSLNRRELDWVEDRINQFLRSTESGLDCVHGAGEINPSHGTGPDADIR